MNQLGENMATQAQKAKHFRKLHVPGEPLILFNVWDAGSAKAVAEAGVQALATSSWAVAATRNQTSFFPEQPFAL
jgi:2-methylisocitrate lyase-like PEP mutase family enzyme